MAVTVENREMVIASVPTWNGRFSYGATYGHLVTPIPQPHMGIFRSIAHVLLCSSSMIMFYFCLIIIVYYGCSLRCSLWFVMVILHYMVVYYGHVLVNHHLWLSIAETLKISKRRQVVVVQKSLPIAWVQKARALSWCLAGLLWVNLQIGSFSK